VRSGKPRGSRWGKRVVGGGGGAGGLALQRLSDMFHALRGAKREDIRFYARHHDDMASLRPSSPALLCAHAHGVHPVPARFLPGASEEERAVAILAHARLEMR